VPAVVPGALPEAAAPGEVEAEGSIPGDGFSVPAEGDEPLPKGTKVYKETSKGDKTGDKNLPFDKLFIAYWGSDPHTPYKGQKGATMADALKEGYNVIAMSFADQFQADGTFGIDTNMCSGPQAPPDTGPGIGPWKDFIDPNTGLKGPHTHQCMPSKKNVSEAAGIPMDSWRYVLSFGGAAGPGPRMEESQDPAQEDTFADGFVETYLAYKKGYGFDGIDIDVESSINSPVLRTFRKIYQKLHEKGELISMAPETPSLVSASRPRPSNHRPCPFISMCRARRSSDVCAPALRAAEPGGVSRLPGWRNKQLRAVGRYVHHRLGQLGGAANVQRRNPVRRGRCQVHPVAADLVQARLGRHGARDHYPCEQDRPRLPCHPGGRPGPRASRVGDPRGLAGPLPQLARADGHKGSHDVVRRP